MSNYVEYKNQIAFHPGYYIKEYIDELGLTQEDFANRLGTTPKNISILIRGEQSLSLDIANKLSKVMGTSVKFWLNLQNEYDELCLKFKEKEELIAEKEIFQNLDYSYFEKYFQMPSLPRKVDEQITQVRSLLGVASLKVFKNPDMYTDFRSVASEITEINVIKANIMVQLAMNMSLKNKEISKFNKNKLESMIPYILTLTEMEDDFFPLLEKCLFECGVHLIVMPNLKGSKVNGATKKVNHHILLMISNRNTNSDSFWFTLFHEIGHILQSDLGISYDKERKADRFAEDQLIPWDEYQEFLKKGTFTAYSITDFAKKIHRDPGIVVGRLRNDGYIRYVDPRFEHLKKQYVIAFL